MVLLTHLCGLRVCELANLRVSDVVNENGKIRDLLYLDATQTKGSEVRRVFVGKRAKSALKRYLQSNTSVLQRTFLFNTQKSNRFNTNALTQLIKRLYERSGIRGASSHSGRRSFITNLANKGVNVRVIAELASHKSIQTTQRYIEASETTLANAVDLL
jgi:integrase/recombinase XerD